MKDVDDVEIKIEIEGEGDGMEEKYPGPISELESFSVQCSVFRVSCIDQ